MKEDEIERRTHTSPAARLLLIVFGVVLVALLVVVAEIALGIAGVGPPRQLFLRSNVAGEEVWQLNRDFSQFFFPKWVERPLAYATLPIKKPADSYRIFALGASTTLGDPFGYQTAYPALLGEMLSDIAPGKRYEVANCACIAISSLDELWMQKQAVRYDPDLVILYTGHNEAFGTDGIDSPLQRSFKSRAAAKFWLWFRNLRLVHLARTLTGSKKPPADVDPAGEGFGMWSMRNRAVPAASEKHDRMLRFYQENVLEMLALAREAGVDVVLCTSIGNERDQSPLGSVHGPDFRPGTESAWQTAYDRGVSASDARDWPAARAAFEECCALDPGHAVVRFRLARCLDALGDSAAAFAEYIAARDLDPVHFRACTEQNDIVRAIAREWDTQGRHRLAFVDLDRELQADYRYGAGQGFFTEHVHPYPEGQAWMAREMTLGIARSGLAADLGECDTTRLQPLARYPERRGMTPLDVAAGLLLTDRFKLAKWPFTSCYDNAEMRARMQAEIDSLRRQLNPIELELCDAIVTDASGDSYDYAARHYSLFTQYRSRRMGPEALRELLRVRAYWPPLAFVETDLAQLMVAMRRIDEAERCLSRARQLDADYAPIHFVAGALLHSRGNRAEAAQEFRAYLETDESGPYADAARQALAALSQSPR